MTASRESTPDTPALLQEARAHQSAGRLDEARVLYRRVLDHEPDNADVLYALAVLARQLERPAIALRRLREAVAHRPDFLDARILLGNTLAALGELRDAAVHYEAALGIDAEHAGVHLNLGNVLQALGRTEEARSHFERALALEPDMAQAHNNLGLLTQRQGRLEPAVEHYRRALALQPDYAAAHNNLGTALRELGRFDAAVGHYETALRLEPGVEAQANLAAILERANRPEDARLAAERALEFEAGNAKARLVLAKVKVRQGDRAGAGRDFEALIAELGEGADEGTTLTAARAQADLARLYEGAGDFERAMAHYREANRLNCRNHPAWEDDAKDYLDWVDALDRMLDELKHAPWRPEPTTDRRPAPIFLVGFPRSGTTLLDQALAALPGVALMEEKTVLDTLREELGGPEESRLNRLIALTEADRLELRRRYWQIAERHVAAPLEGRRLVDKMPLNLLNLWLVHGLFPEAKVVVSLRDPRDVCLSCFTTLFRLRGGVANFPTLEHSAALYSAVMGLWLKQRALLALDTRTLRYEDLVQSFEPQLRALVAFLGLTWHDDVLDYAERARSRYIATPSYDQVVEPLYTTSIGRWRHYAAHLDPIQDALRPFVEAFGYD